MKWFNIATGNAAVIIVTVVLIVAIYMSYIKAEYKDIFALYDAAKSEPDIGPWRIALCNERQAIANIVLSKPIPASAAMFMMLVIRYKSPKPSQVTNGFGSIGDLDGMNDGTHKIPGFLDSDITWAKCPLADPNSWAIPYDSELIANHKKENDFSLTMLWTRGLEQFVRYRFSAEATTVNDVWDEFYKIDQTPVPPPPPKPPTDSCNKVAAWTGIGTAAVGGAAAGSMLAPPAGTVIGGLLGAAGSLATSFSCLF